MSDYREVTLEQNAGLIRDRDDDEMIKKKQKIHLRKINTAIYQGETGNLVVEGRLIDDRLMNYYRHSGEIHPPGTIHDMILRLSLEQHSLTILDLEVEMPTVPSGLCRETIDFLEPLKGLSISPGFTYKVKDLLGGPKGCCHILELLMAMAPAAFQGAVSASIRKPFETIDVSPFIDTCWLWRKDGHWLEELNNMIKS